MERAVPRSLPPRHLRAAGLRPHGAAGLLEDLLEFQAGLRHRGGERSRVHRVGAVAILGDLGSGGRVREEERPRRRVHARQSAAAANVPAGGGEGVVAAGVQHDDVQRRGCLFHLFQHQRRPYRPRLQVLFGLHLGINGNQVVGAARLHAVPSVVEQGHAAASASAQVAAERHDGILQRLLVRVFDQPHGEADPAQRLRHQPGIVHRVAQRAQLAPVRAVPNHECNAGTGGLGRRGPNARQRS